ncbi:hypothetical protein R1flu_013059 [Riccia fluitans]|uniref:Uncharacterized protein n=1 Tax=Riccia fluitans TaxID=41844 RepID=A0ABD1ZFS8_9MARC
MEALTQGPLLPWKERKVPGRNAREMTRKGQNGKPDRSETYADVATANRNYEVATDHPGQTHPTEQTDPRPHEAKATSYDVGRRRTGKARAYNPEP